LFPTALLNFSLSALAKSKMKSTVLNIWLALTFDCIIISELHIHRVARLLLCKHCNVTQNGNGTKENDDGDDDDDDGNATEKYLRMQYYKMTVSHLGDSLAF